MYNMTVTWDKIDLTPPKQAMREKVNALQNEIMKLPQVELPTTTMFHGGMMRREVICPKGSVIVGKIHKSEHFFIVLSGVMRLTTDDEVVEVTGPFIINSKPNTKRAAFAVTDSVCVTFHRCDALNETDAEIELIQPESSSLFDEFNKVKSGVLTWQW